MLGGQKGAREIVVHYFGSGQVAEHAVELDQLDAAARDFGDVVAVFGFERVRHDDAGHLVAYQRLQASLFVFEPLVRLADEHIVARRVQDGFGAADDVAEELPVDARHNHPDRVRHAAPQRRGQNVAFVTEFGRLPLHRVASLTRVLPANALDTVEGVMLSALAMSFIVGLAIGFEL